VLLAIRRGHQHADILANELVGGIAEDALRGGVDRLDDPALVDRDDAVDRRIENGIQPRLPIVESLARAFQLMADGQVESRPQKEVLAPHGLRVKILRGR
jgi:hypothetical protein